MFYYDTALLKVENPVFRFYFKTKVDLPLRYPLL